MKKIVLKVNINCSKCKTDVLKTVTKLSGINEVSVDGVKGTLTVVGEVDPVLVTTRLRKIGKVVEIISVGPPKPDPPKPDPPKPDNLKLPLLPYCCNECKLVAITSFTPPYDAGFCSIL